jgi:excisionase family DNA binding protein
VYGTESASTSSVGFDGSATETQGQRSLLIDDAARLLGVSRQTVYYRISQGRLFTIRTRCGSQRVLLASIESLLRESSTARLATGAGEIVARSADACE